MRKLLSAMPMPPPRLTTYLFAALMVYGLLACAGATPGRESPSAYEAGPSRPSPTECVLSHEYEQGTLRRIDQPPGWPPAVDVVSTAAERPDAQPECCTEATGWWREK